MKERSIEKLEKDRGILDKRALIVAASITLLVSGAFNQAQATEPCDDFDECKVLVEINATDGDIGFHWLIDAEDLNSTRIDDANGSKVYENKAYGPLKDQKLTETFGESAEPICKESLKEEEDDVVVTVSDFVGRWVAGPYDISGKSDGGEQLSGETHLTHWLPAAPNGVAFDQNSGVISWNAGDDLGECADVNELTGLVSASILPVHPMNVPISTWEVVFEVEDFPNLKFAARIPFDNSTMVTLPNEISAIINDTSKVPNNTKAKVEVGAIGGNLTVILDDDNATFSETPICLNEVAPGCQED